MQQALEAGVDRGHVVEPRGREEFVLCAEAARRIRRIGRELVREDAPAVEMAFIREKIEERIVRAPAVIRARHAEHREERQHVLLRVERLPFVDLAVHVDGEMRYRQKRPADVDEVHLRRVRVCARKHDLARKRQRPVEPRAPYHAAVDLDVERAIALRCDDR